MAPFGYVSVASPLHDAEVVQRVEAGVASVLEPLGGHRVDAPDRDTSLPLAVVVVTGGTEVAVLDVVARRRALVPWEPVLLVAHPLHNSLPAALEALARLQQDGVRGRVEQVDGTRDGACAHRLATSIADVACVHRLHATRVGLVGAPSDWLVASVPDRAAVRDRWGPEVVDVDIGQVVDAHREAPPDATRAVAVRYLGRRGRPAPDGSHVSPVLEAAAAIHPALDHAIRRERLDAVAVRCFDFVTGLATSGCVALAELNDAGVVAGCEGDVASTVAMLLVRALLDQPAWIANPAWIDPDSDHVVLAHCTVAPSMVDGIELHSHFESGLGVGLRGRFRPGPVTLVRLGGSSLDRCWIADGDIEASGTSPDLCRTQVTVRIVDRPARALLDQPLGNHLVLVHGHHRRRLERWWNLAIGPLRAA